MNVSTQPTAAPATPSSRNFPVPPLTASKPTPTRAAKNRRRYKWPKRDVQIPLLSNTAIAVTAFFGGAFAGCIMISINLLLRDGKKAMSSAIAATLLGLVGSTATVAAFTLAPSLALLTIPLYLGASGIVASYAESNFGTDYATRLQSRIKPMYPVIILAVVMVGILYNLIVTLSVISLTV